MITVYCALYQEAQELIRIYHLKKETDRRHFQTFSSEEAKIRLVVTGVGTAATAVAETSTVYPPGKTDVLVNFGSCGGSVIRLWMRQADVLIIPTFFTGILFRKLKSRAFPGRRHMDSCQKAFYVIWKRRLFTSQAVIITVPIR